jgi:molybdopterin converting factor small subunit
MQYEKGEGALTIQIHLHQTHRQYAAGQDAVEVEGLTVGECLSDLTRKYPQMKNQLFDAQGKLKKTIEIYLNMQSAYPDELAKSTRSGDSIHILLMLAGG